MLEAADAHREFSWEQTAEIIANQLNVAAHKHVVSGRDINPYRKSKQKQKQLYLDDMISFLEP